jgi:biopolymer transport protein ExbB
MQAICVGLVAAILAAGPTVAMAQAPEPETGVTEPPASIVEPAPVAPADGTDAESGSAPAQPPGATSQAEPRAEGDAPAATEFLPAAEETVDAERPATLPHDLSPMGMFQNADIVVKAVMIGLAVASLVTWTVWVGKSLELWLGRRRMRRATDVIVAARSLRQAGAALEGGRGPATLLVRAAEQEVELSTPALDHANCAGLKERVASRLSRIEAQSGRRMTMGTGLVATIGSTAPFVGLFGTVWGIMNAFIGISEAQTTNLAVVAPGIAEALFATALGLVAAIPAVVIYNVFARRIAGERQLLADAAAGVERLVSRDLDNRAVPARALAAE